MIKLGDSGTEVRRLQLQLASIGYKLKGTGYFGPATDVAVEAFQKRAGLKVDGVVGPKTVAALASWENSPAKNIAPIIEVERPLWLQAGLALVGVRETAGARDNQTIIDWAKEEGGAIARDYTHDSIPWCALFANHLLTKVGLKGPETLWALDFNADRMEKRIGRRWPADKLPGPAVGAFAPMLRNGGGHIIVVVGRDQHGNVMGLGGNQSDQVSIIPFPRSRLNEGFWWPQEVRLPAQIGFDKLPIVRSDGRVSRNEA